MFPMYGKSRMKLYFRIIEPQRACTFNCVIIQQQKIVFTSNLIQHMKETIYIFILIQNPALR